jgi:hypothetical protein
MRFSRRILTGCSTAILSLSILVATPARSSAQGASPSPEKLAAIKALLTQTNATGEALNAMEASVNTQRQAMPQLPPEFWTEFMKRARAQQGALEQLLIPIYDRNYTLQDLKDMLAFYQSPLGKRMLQTQPRVTQESIAAGAEWGRRIGEEVGREVLSKKPTNQ